MGSTSYYISANMNSVCPLIYFILVLW